MYFKDLWHHVIQPMCKIALVIFRYSIRTHVRSVTWSWTSAYLCALYHVYYFSWVSEQAVNWIYRYWHEIFAEKLTKNSTSGAFQQTPIKHHRIVIANVSLQYRKTGHVSWKENEVISNDIWLINIHELVSTHLWKSTKSTWVCPMVVWRFLLVKPTNPKGEYIDWTSIKIEAHVHYFVTILEHKVNT